MHKFEFGDGLILVGLAAVVTGITLIYMPAGLIAGGILTAVLGYIASGRKA